MKGVQCYELFGGLALKNHPFFITEVFNLLYFVCGSPKMLHEPIRSMRISDENRCSRPLLGKERLAGQLAPQAYIVR